MQNGQVQTAPNLAGSTFDQQQQNFYQFAKPQQQQNMMVDQRIEERESLRHSTHRSQRSDRVQGAHTATDRFNKTLTDDHQERLNGTKHHLGHHDNDEGPEMYTEMPH